MAVQLDHASPTPTFDRTVHAHVTCLVGGPNTPFFFNFFKYKIIFLLSFSLVIAYFSQIKRDYLFIIIDLKSIILIIFFHFIA